MKGHDSSNVNAKQVKKDGPTALKRAMTKYRRRGGEDPLDGWSEWIDPGHPDDYACLQQVKLAETNLEENSSSYYQGPIYELAQKPGFYICPQALETDLQTALAFAALTEYCNPPHKTNVDGVPPKPHEVMNEPHETYWYVWKQQQQQEKVNHPQQHDSNPKYRSFHKLAWSVMGYHYDWTLRKYDVDADSTVPPTLQRLGELFAHTALRLQQQQPPGNTNISMPQFTASACIVNYYHSKSVMGPHRDDSEYDMTKPIVSFCLGRRPCLFVMAGDTPEDTNIVPIVLRPGDVVLMGGPSRLVYHSMARLLPLQLPVQPVAPLLHHGHAVPRTVDDEPLPTTDEDKVALEAFVLEHRININVRQVYCDGQDPHRM
eukprot:scaffold2257_cov169-Amphora_coffeaeformis.AAC.5